MKEHVNEIEAEKQLQEGMLTLFEQFECKNADLLDRTKGHTVNICTIWPWNVKTRKILAHGAATTDHDFLWGDVSKVTAMSNDCDLRNGHPTLQIRLGGNTGACHWGYKDNIGYFGYDSWNRVRGFGCFWVNAFISPLYPGKPDTTIFLTWLTGLLPEIKTALEIEAAKIDKETSAIKKMTDTHRRNAASKLERLTGIINGGNT